MSVTHVLHARLQKYRKNTRVPIRLAMHSSTSKTVSRLGETGPNRWSLFGAACPITNLQATQHIRCLLSHKCYIDECRVIIVGSILQMVEEVAEPITLRFGLGVYMLTWCYEHTGKFSTYNVFVNTMNIVFYKGRHKRYLIHKPIQFYCSYMSAFFQRQTDYLILIIS